MQARTLESRSQSGLAIKLTGTAYVQLIDFFFQKNNSLVLQVSTNQGRTFKSAQVPVVSKNQFYSVLDMSEDMIFIHVDIAGGCNVNFLDNL